MFRYITRKFTNKQILIKPKLINKSISDLNTKFYNMNTNNKKYIDNMNITTNKNSSVITDIKSTAIVFCTTIIISLTVCLTVFSK